MRSPFSLLCLPGLLLIAPAAAVRADKVARDPHLQSTRNAPAVNRKLPDIPIFRDKKSSQAINAGGGAIVARDDSGTLPVDTTQTFDGLPALRVDVSGTPEGSWQVLFAALDWRTFDLLPYREHGTLEFNVRGEQGGETFGLYFGGRKPGQAASSPTLASSDFVKVSTNWQRVRIPLKTLLPDVDAFPVQDAHFLTLQKAGSGPLRFWLNNVRITTPDAESASPVLKINQVGYLPLARKRALVSGFPDELKASPGMPFRILPAPPEAGKTDANPADTTPAFAGTLSRLTELDAAISGERVLAADFTGLHTPGRYVLDIAGVGRSTPFRIASDLYKPLLRDAVRYFYLQRSGMPLNAKYAGPFARGEGHPQDRALPYQSDPTNVSHKRDVHGGWYDAGDYGKYVSMAAKPVSDLLWAYELFPASFQDGMANIPESGNGIPDILDETKWELDWMLRMQDAESGGFYQKVWPNNANLTPDKDPQPRFVYDKVGMQGNVRPTGATAAACAVLAHAAVVYRKIDASYSAKLLQAARRGWSYLEANPKPIVAYGMTGAIEDDLPYRRWAAGELYRATSDAKFGGYFLTDYAKYNRVWQDDTDTGYGNDIGVLGWFAYLRTAKPDPAAQTWFSQQFAHWREQRAARLKAGAWDNYLLEGNYFWGSNEEVADTVFLLALGQDATHTPDPSLTQGARSSLDYLLGVNPLAFSYVSGYGSRSVRHIYSCIWTNDGLAPIPPGYLAGGPNAFESRSLSHFAARCYRDSEFEWTTNENAIYWNSALVFLTAFVDSERSR